MKFSFFRLLSSQILFVVALGFHNNSLAVNIDCKNIFYKKTETVKVDSVGYNSEAEKTNFLEAHTLDIPDYLLRNLGSSAEELSQRYDRYLILVGEPKDYNQILHSEKIRITRTVDKSYGTHRLSEGVDKQGRLVLLVSNLYVNEQVLRTQLLLKAAEIPGSKVKTFGNFRSLKDVYAKLFHQMGAPPDIVIYGFAGTFLHQILQLNPRISLSRLKFSLAMKKKNNSDWNSKWNEPFYSLTLADGTRIWLLTNVYGEHAKYLFKALTENYNPQLFLAMGTAGALNLSIDRGQLFSPDQILSENGELIKTNFIPLKSSSIPGTYARVQTPLVETQSWLNKNKELGVDVVDVELGHIIEVHQSNPQIPLKAAFLISDQIRLNNQTNDLSKWNKSSLNDSSGLLFSFLQNEIGRTSAESWKIENVQVHYKNEGDN